MFRFDGCKVFLAAGCRLPAFFWIAANIDGCKVLLASGFQLPATGFYGNAANIG